MDKKWWKEAVVYQIYPRSFNWTQNQRTRRFGDLKKWTKNGGSHPVWTATETVI